MNSNDEISEELIARIVDETLAAELPRMRLEEVCKAATAVVQSVCSFEGDDVNHAQVVLTFASSIHSAAALLSPLDSRDREILRLGNALGALRSSIPAPAE